MNDKLLIAAVNQQTLEELLYDLTISISPKSLVIHYDVENHKVQVSVISHGYKIYEHEGEYLVKTLKEFSLLIIADKRKERSLKNDWTFEDTLRVVESIHEAQFENY